MLAALDDSIGQLMKTLKARGMYDNTVIMFTTDNGGPANGFDANAANNFPLRFLLINYIVTNKINLLMFNLFKLRVCDIIYESQNVLSLSLHCIHVIK